MFAVETGYRESDNPVACIGNPLHLHAAFGTYKQYLCIRSQFHYSVGDGYGREDVSSCASTADDNSKFFFPS